MIIINSNNPKKSLYVMGAYILKVFKDAQSSEIDVDKLYDNLVLEYQEEITFNYFSYSLTWLFLCGKLSIDKTTVKICN